MLRRFAFCKNASKAIVAIFMLLPSVKHFFQNLKPSLTESAK
jgi:hypothetical protein